MTAGTLFWLLLPITLLAWCGVILAGEIVWAEVVKPWWVKRRQSSGEMGLAMVVGLCIVGLFIAAAIGAGIGMILLGVGYRYFTGIWPCVP